MTKQLMMQRLAAIVTSLGDEGTPESMLYIFCEMNMADYELIRLVLIRAKYIQIKGHYVTLTPLGKETAIAINAALSNKEGV